MIDLQYIQFSDTLNITGAQEIPDFLPRSLHITGEDFRHAIEVLINEVNSPSFVIASKNVIIAEVPNSQLRAIIQNLSILSSDFTATYQSRIRFRFGLNPTKTEGLRFLMQMYLKLLFTSAGSDAFSKNIGGSALKNLGKSFQLSQGQSIVSDFAIAVRRAESQMKTIQSQQTGFKDEERLLSASLLNATFEPNLTALLARVELISQAGTRAIANLEL